MNEKMAFNPNDRVRVSSALSDGFLNACGLLHRKDKIGFIVEMLMPNSPTKHYKDSPIYRVLFDGEKDPISINAKLLEMA